jgi:hypothetical protein
MNKGLVNFSCFLGTCVSLLLALTKLRNSIIKYSRQCIIRLLNIYSSLFQGI